MTAFLRLLLPLMLLLLIGLSALAAPPLGRGSPLHPLAAPQAVSQTGPRIVAAVQAARLFFSGPAIIVLFISLLAVLALLAMGIRRTDSLFLVGLAASERLESHRLVPVLWGLSFGVLVLALAGICFAHHALALLGLLDLIGGLCLVALGLAASALNFGRELSQAADTIDTDHLASLRLGLAAFFFASFIPFVGWVIVLLYAAAGTGVVLETLFSRRGL